MTELTNEDLNNQPPAEPPVDPPVEPPIDPPADPPADPITDTIVDFKIPDEYSSNQTVASAKSIEDLCKTIVNQETLIGKKTIGIPDEKATPEEVAKFKEAFGVPQNFEDYTLEVSENIKTIYGEGDKAVMDEFKKVLHEAGVNTKQAETLKNGYDSILGGLLTKQKEAQDAAVAEFDNIVKTNFGEAKDEKLQVAEQFLKENLSDNMKPYLPVVLGDAKALAIVADIANNIFPDMKPDNFNPGGGSPSGKTLVELNAEIQAIIGTPEFQNNRHPGHDAKKAEWLEVAKQIDALKNK